MNISKKPDLKVHIIAPSAYEKSGELKQYSKVLMLPPAFAVLDSLIEEAGRNLGVLITTAHYNERTERGEGYIDRIIRESQDKFSTGRHLIFITTKSFELSRAIDINRRLAKDGIKTVMGGPGITLADCETYKYFVKNGFSFNVGEGENTIGKIIKDAINNKLKICYWQKGFVDLRKAPLPKLPEKREHDLTLTRYAALGTNEGCPFACDFCTVIEIRGRSMAVDRSRRVEDCVNWIRETTARGFSEIMLTTDNFHKAFIYQELKDALINLNDELLTKTGKGLRLLVQLDLEKSILKEIKELAAMGVSDMFFGMETSDPLALSESKKYQNNPNFYPELSEECHKYGITVSSGVMICFPSQTPESIHTDMLNFSKILDLPHPYAVTPLPQSKHWLEAVRKKELTTWDPNDYDSTQCIRKWFKNMTIEQAQEAYYKSFTDLFPLKDLFWERPQLSLKYKILRRLYGRGLAEYGRRFRGRPWHIMMDGIPQFRGVKVQRPADSFRGIPLDSNDPKFKDIVSYRKAKEEYLATIV